MTDNTGSVTCLSRKPYIVITTDENILRWPSILLLWL